MTSHTHEELYHICEEKLKHKDNLIWMIVHDIRIPLTVIDFNAKQILEDLEDHPSKTSVQKILYNCEKAVSLVQSLLDAAKLAATGFALSYKKVPLGDYLSKIVEDLQPIAIRNKTLILNHCQMKDLVRIDPKCFAHILENLIINAIKFSPEGGVVSIDGELTEEGVSISVKDQGRGIPEDKINQLFQKYKQLEDVELAKTLGVGLGLTIAQEMALAHGAALKVQSRVGQGSTFFIHLPSLKE